MRRQRAGTTTPSQARWRDPNTKIPWNGMAFMAMPHLLIIKITLQETSLERGLQCFGCKRAVCRYYGREEYKCKGCKVSTGGGVDEPLPSQGNSSAYEGKYSCKVAIDRWRLYTKEEILQHISQCIHVQEYLADLNLECNRPRRRAKKLGW